MTRASKRGDAGGEPHGTGRGDPPKDVAVRIDELAAGGDGVGRDAAGRVTFVPYTAPGDVARVRIAHERRGYARGELLDLVERSPDRVRPRCRLFEAQSCGGCQWQHVAAPAQRAAKQAIVAAALRHLVAAGLKIEPIEAPVPEYGWRRRARLSWYRGRGAPAATIGLFAPGTHRVTDVPRCPQLAPALETALGAIRDTLAPSLGRRGEIELVAGRGDAVHVAVHGVCGADAARRLAARPGIAGVAAAGERFGAETIELEPGLSGRADEFAQASEAGNLALLDAVDRATTPRDGARVLELYAGSGNLTRVLARGAREVVAVERVRHRGARRRAGAGEGSVRRISGGAGEAVGELAARGERFDLAVLDPPRSGAAEVVEPLAELAPPRILYVSCDPATLARDAARLAQRGYRALAAQPLDLMPQTAHVEVVLSLARDA